DSAANIGVIFWGSNSDNRYEADILPSSGKVAVFRVQHSKFLKPVSWMEDASIVKGTSATNEVSVTVNGNKATLAINDKKVIDFTGQPPEGGSMIGITLETEKEDTGPSTFTIKSIQVRALEAEPQKAP